MTDLDAEIDRYVNNRRQDSKLSDSVDYHFNFMYTDEGEHMVDVYRDKKHVLRATYEILGCYNIVCSIWVWGYNISQVEKDLTESSRRVKQFANDLAESTVSDDGQTSPSRPLTKTMEEYIYYSRNPSFFVSYKNLDRVLRLGLYVTKGLDIVARKDGDQPKIVEFILLKKIIQEKPA